jgi:hypothetical protein
MPGLRNDCQPINAPCAQALYELSNPLVGGNAKRNNQWAHPALSQGISRSGAAVPKKAERSLYFFKQ